MKLKAAKGSIRVLAMSAVLFALCLFVSGMTGETGSYAFASVGSVNGTPYDSFGDLTNAVEGMEGQTITIEMAGNWDAYRDSQFDKRLIIPENSTATLNMHGWVFDRNRVKNNNWCSNGELICVESGASLTINGGSENTEHREHVYTSTNKSDAATEAPKSFYGGVLTGGNSTNGAGGIHAKSDVTLTLNQVTLAGCRAAERWGDGYGGGVCFADENATLKLKDSTITGCYAEMDGGGVYGTNEDKMNIELINSHIDKNYCRAYGAGIYLGGEKCVIKGDEKSSVSGNAAEENGGGIHLDNDLTTVKGTGKGLTINGNQSNSGYGGGICSMEENITLSNLKVTNNTAPQAKAGGIYVNNDRTTIENCTITGNNGGGVAAPGKPVTVNDDAVDEDFFIKGKTIIKDNRDTYLPVNLCLEDEHVRVMFDLTSGADVHMGYSKLQWMGAYAMVTEGEAGDTIKNKNCLRFLTAENKGYDNKGYHFTYNDAPDYRKIFYVENGYDDKPDVKEIVGEAYEKPPAPKQVRVKSIYGAGPGFVCKVKKGGEPSDSGSFDLIGGYFRHQKTDDGSVDKDAVFYYSDGLFYDQNTAKASYTYNEHLATTSLAMAFSGMYLTASQDADENGNTYYNKHAGARQFMADIGCPDQNIYINDYNAVKPGTDSIGVTIASKNLQQRGDGDKLEDTGDILIPIVTRGGGYEAEWASNLTMGLPGQNNGEHQGFAEAADHVVSEVDYYIAKYNLEDELAAGRVKFWVAGYSRGGATANLVSRRLVEKYATGADGKNNEVFGYTFEAPKGGVDKAENVDASKYYCIHNTINDGDIVPLLGMEEMGFKRYGVDHYCPGTTAGDPVKTEKNAPRSSDSSITKVTTYADNKPIKTKTEEYYSIRTKMEEQLKYVDSGMIFDDYFHPMAMDFLPSDVFETGKYDGTHEEDFIKDFVAMLQYGDSEENWTAIPNRSYYASRRVNINGTSYATTQRAAREASALVFGLSGEDTAGFVERASTIVDGVSQITWFWRSDITQRELYANVIGAWYKLSDAEKMKYLNFFWGSLKDSGALEFLPAEEVAKLEKNWPTLANLAFKFVDTDYNYKPGKSGSAWAGGSGESMMYAGTFMTFSDYIMSNHYPEVNIAWLRALDDYYEDEGSEYTVNADGYTPDAPVAKAGDTKLTAPDNINEFTDDQKIILDVEKINGEAIYYDLTDTTNNTVIAKNQIYRGGIDLLVGTAATDYKLSAYAMSYGKKSGAVTYLIRQSSGRHDVAVNYDGADRPQQSFSYKEGETVRLTAPNTTNGTYFSGWTVKTQQGTDVTETLLGEKAGETVCEFTMPKVGDADTEAAFSKDYSLIFTATYKKRIDSLEVTKLAAPAAGTPLAETATVQFDNGVTGQYPVVWKYQTGDEDPKPLPAQGVILKDTIYSAWISMEQDQAKDIVFSMKVNAKDINGETADFRKDFDDGSLRVCAGTFEITDGDAINIDDLIPLIVSEIDLSTGEQDTATDPETLEVYPGALITLTAPDVTDEVFTRWNVDGSNAFACGIMLAEGSKATDKTIRVQIPEDVSADRYVIDAQYTPVIKEVHAEVAAPQAGKPLAETANVTVQITNAYEISPEYTEVAWTPAPASGKAEYLTGYTATVTVKPKTDADGPYMEVRAAGSAEGTAYVKRSAYFMYSDALKASINETEDAVCDTTNNSINTTFEPIAYNLVSIRQPDSVSGLPYGTDPNVVLPDSTTVVRSDGSEVRVAITWDSLSKPVGVNPLDETTWSAKGEIKLPDSIENPDELSLKVAMTITVSQADTVAAPTTSVESGTYLADQAVTLSSATEGADIYYTTDGTEPSKNSKKYEGETISVKRADATDNCFTIRAIAMKKDMRTSSEMCSQYIFTNELSVPAGESLLYNSAVQTGVASSNFYTLEVEEGSRAIIDSKGNATAKNVGEYKVTAEPKEGFKWKILSYVRTEDTKADKNKKYYEEKDGEYVKANPQAGDDISELGWFERVETTSEKPETITFTIAKANLAEDAAIVTKTSYNTVSALKKDAKVTIDGKVLSKSDYTMTVSKVINGQVTVTVKAKGENCTGTLKKVVKVLAIDQMGAGKTAFGKGASAGAANYKLVRTKSNKDPKGTKIAPLLVKSTSQGKTSIKLTWKKAKGTARYVVYGAQTGGYYKLLAGVKGRSYNVKKINKVNKKLKQKTYYKFIVVALDKNGNVVTTSKVVHVATKGNLKKAANPKAVVVKAKVSKTGKKLKKYKKTSAVGVKKGKTVQLRASYTKAKKSKVVKKAGIRFESSNKKIATVSAKGKVKGKKKGKAYIYVYAQNGVCKKIKVIVK